MTELQKLIVKIKQERQEAIRNIGFAEGEAKTCIESADIPGAIKQREIWHRNKGYADGVAFVIHLLEDIKDEDTADTSLAYHESNNDEYCVHCNFDACGSNDFPCTACAHNVVSTNRSYFVKREKQDE